MTPALMLFALLAGMALVEFLIHRPDRKRRAEDHAADLFGVPVAAYAALGRAS